ncbi:xanthine dehydrogenase family protein molybdopterin-binding subunit [Rhodocytophaga rosea]|uniref:Xanthine dehydrogenase family protein molybdopterin-binding subunit n=1 Tax=Rhodocytophaga rosea TaxID=2704465 RepID=A0A6C0GRY6_9BACT|nr:xanthine dehydrogenase family protein molybdopterin-binding subunit [Rhodocytophaga rosea]QHT70624.1 xanthine dehydrogenase family protein molybdopterin-binding subunit [Rhodocytophaga rosea]
MNKQATVPRRVFLKTSALFGGGLLLSFFIPAQPNKVTSGPIPFTPNTLLHIGEDDSIHIILTKVEMGQGIGTTLAMLIAEELDCDWKKIKIRHSPAGKQFADPDWGQSTGGSTSTLSEFDRYRQVGATARVMLIEAAANRFGVKPADCSTENGYVIIKGKEIRYGDLASEAAAIHVPAVQLRQPKEWRYIGKSQNRLDIPDKINGKAIYGLDIHFSGLLTAVVAHAPIFGAKVKSFDASRAMAIQGVRDVIQIPSGIAVLGDHYWAAKMGRDALKIEWELGENVKINTQLQVEEYRRIAKTQGTYSQQKGDTSAALQKASHVLETEHTVPYLAHAPMEPLNCTVKPGKDSCEIWVGNQNPLLFQQIVADLLGMKPEQVSIHTPEIGGSFGRKASFDADWVVEAVHIARISGKAVKLVWSREDDIRGGYYRPLYLHRAVIGIGNDGYPSVWQHHIVGQSIFAHTPLDKLIIKDRIDYSSVGGVHGSPYINPVPNHNVALHTTTVGVPVLSWRSVGHSHTCFVMETLIDELAFMAAKDPLDYRYALLKDHPRHLAVLTLAAEKAGWRKPLPPGMFRGIAVHEAMGSYVSQVIEISIQNRKLRIHRVVCAIDCGLVVNPDGVRAQMEGSIVFALTAALYGEITLEKGQVKQSNFHDYRMLRIHEMPEIEIHIVPGTKGMGGVGEPGVPPVAPALLNAIFAATGKRLRRLPVRIEDTDK